MEYQEQSFSVRASLTSSHVVFLTLAKQLSFGLGCGKYLSGHSGLTRSSLQQKFNTEDQKPKETFTILIMGRKWLQDELLVVKQKMVKENSNFHLGKIISRAQPASNSKGHKSCWFWCIILCQQKQLNMNIKSKICITYFSYHIVNKFINYLLSIYQA